jgi:hypothetical protein
MGRPFTFSTVQDIFYIKKKKKVFFSMIVRNTSTTVKMFNAPNRRICFSPHCIFLKIVYVFLTCPVLSCHSCSPMSREEIFHLVRIHSAVTDNTKCSWQLRPFDILFIFMLSALAQGSITFS